MLSRRLIIAGLGAIVLGLLAFSVGAIASPADLLVGLIVLMFFPLLIAFCGSVLVVVGLSRTFRDDRSRISRRLIALSSMVGVGVAFAFMALGVLSQFPDYEAGRNGAFSSGPSAIGSIPVIIGMGLVAGATLGAAIALVWRGLRDRTKSAGEGT